MKTATPFAVGAGVPLFLLASHGVATSALRNTGSGTMQLINGDSCSVEIRGYVPCAGSTRRFFGNASWPSSLVEKNNGPSWLRRAFAPRTLVSTGVAYGAFGRPITLYRSWRAVAARVSTICGPRAFCATVKRPGNSWLGGEQPRKNLAKFNQSTHPECVL